MIKTYPLKRSGDTKTQRRQ